MFYIGYQQPDPRRMQKITTRQASAFELKGNQKLMKLRVK
jgi:hypothetical protein